MQRRVVVVVANVAALAGLVGLMTYGLLVPGKDSAPRTADAGVTIRLEPTRTVETAPVGTLSLAAVVVDPLADAPLPDVPLADAPLADVPLADAPLADPAGVPVVTGSLTPEVAAVAAPAHGGAKVRDAYPVRVASLGNISELLPSKPRAIDPNGPSAGELIIGSLFREQPSAKGRVLHGATPAPAAVPLTRRSATGDVLTLSFAPPPFLVRNVDPEARADLMQAEEVARHTIAEAEQTKDRRLARERYCLAAAVYYEARGEPHSGQMAVAQVVLNRVADPRYPNTICGVVFQDENQRHRCQFSFACDGRPERPRPGEAWTRSLELAKEFQDGTRYSEVEDATHYHASYVRPSWSRSNEMRRVGRIGGHIFYNES
jgi:spore germination cell wall hydrolase CwlJ-like protein